MRHKKFFENTLLAGFIILFHADKCRTKIEEAIEKKSAVTLVEPADFFFFHRQRKNLTSPSPGLPAHSKKYTAA